MNRLQSFTYNPANSPGTHSSPSQPENENAEIEQEKEKEEEEDGLDPATPRPQRIPLSDLMSNTPLRKEETNHDISPEDKVTWKRSPKKILAPQEESPNVTHTASTTTTFLNLLGEDEGKQ